MGRMEFNKHCHPPKGLQTRRRWLWVDTTVIVFICAIKKKKTVIQTNRVRSAPETPEIGTPAERSILLSKVQDNKLLYTVTHRFPVTTVIRCNSGDCTLFNQFAIPQLARGSNRPGVLHHLAPKLVALQLQCCSNIRRHSALSSPSLSVGKYKPSGK